MMYMFTLTGKLVWRDGCKVGLLDWVKGSRCHWRQHAEFVWEDLLILPA